MATRENRIIDLITMRPPYAIEVEKLRTLTLGVLCLWLAAWVGIPSFRHLGAVVEQKHDDPTPRFDFILDTIDAIIDVNGVKWTLDDLWIRSSMPHRALTDAITLCNIGRANCSPPLRSLISRIEDLR
jgi:hypothetical protein